MGRALARFLAARGDRLRTARNSFTELRLRTATEAAGAFYVRCGFSPIDDPAASHALKLVEPG